MEIQKKSVNNNNGYPLSSPSASLKPQFQYNLPVFEYYVRNQSMIIVKMELKEWITFSGRVMVTVSIVVIGADIFAGCLNFRL